MKPVKMKAKVDLVIEREEVKSGDEFTVRRALAERYQRLGKAEPVRKKPARRSAAEQSERAVAENRGVDEE